MKPSRWLAWCMNLVLVLGLAAEVGHAHAATSDASHPCAVCAVGSAPAVAAAPAPQPGAPQPTAQVAAEIPAAPPLARATAVHDSRGPPPAA